MIISVWKPKYKNINKKQEIIFYELMDNDSIFNCKTSGYKVIWKCDNIECKYVNKLHSIGRNHLNINRSKLCNDQIQICHACQFTGCGNPRFGDKRTWEDLMGKEKSDKLKEIYRHRFLGENNISKKNEIKIKKNQLIVNFDNINEYVKLFNYDLLSINGNNKFSVMFLKCDNNHHLEMKWQSFKRGNRCKYCYYESLRSNIEDIKLFESYSKKVRLLTLINWRSFKSDIDPNGFKKISSNLYHLDHIYSIYDGFKNNIDPIIISSVINLRILNKNENLIKGRNSDVSKEELLVMYYFLVLNIVPLYSPL